MFFNGELCHAKIEDLHNRGKISPLFDENICRFKIAMNQSSLMRGADGRACLQHERNGARGIERRFVREQVTQRATLEQFHHDV